MAKRKEKKQTFADVWRQACEEKKSPAALFATRGPRGCHKYEYKLMTGEVPARKDGNFKEQALRFRAAAEHISFVRQRVQAVLLSHGVLLATFIFYYNFATRVDALQRRFSAETLREMVDLAVQDWLARGCEPAVLKDILSEVFQMGEGEEAAQS